MTTERVTVSLPIEVKQAAQRVASEAGIPFSAVINKALEAWLRTRLVDAWLAEHQREFGVFDETQLAHLAAEIGMAYLPPAERNAAA